MSQVASQAAPLPDATTLLQGVESARLQIPPSRLRMLAVYRSAINTAEPELLVEFDGDRRHYAKSRVGLVVQSIFNGSEVSQFDGVNSVTINDRSRPNAEYLFDPRLFGITTTYSWNGSIAEALPYRNASKIELVGREEIGDKPTWHVRVVDSYKQQIDLWIDDKNGFQVYRYDFSTPEGTAHSSTKSFFDEHIYPWLPSRIETKEFDAKHELTLQREFLILGAETNVNLPESTWTLAGLKPSIGATVTDLRIKQRIGYWDGTSLKAESKDFASHDANNIGRRLLIILIFAATVVAFLFLILRLHSKPSASDANFR